MDPEQDASEGMSTTKKVVAGAAAVGVAVPAAIAVGKKLMGSGSDDEKGDEGQADQQEGKQSGQRGQQGGRQSGRTEAAAVAPSRRAHARARDRAPGRASRRASRARPGPRSSSSGAKSGSRSRSGSELGLQLRSSGSGRQRTKEQLYATAKRLKIEGRSKMTKAQLERAVARARVGNGRRRESLIRRSPACTAAGGLRRRGRLDPRQGSL